MSHLLNFLAKKQSLLHQKLVEEEILIDDSRILQTSLSPYFISSEIYSDLSSCCELVLSAIEKLLRLYAESEDVQNLFPELGKYRDLTCIKPKFKNWIHLARFDLIQTPTGEFKLLETNCANPATVVPLIFKKVYVDIGILDQFLPKGQEVIEQPLDNHNYFIQSLMELSKEVLGKESPNLSFLTSKCKTVSTDIHLLEKFTTKLGYNCKRGNIQDLKFKNGELCLNNFPIDLAYQRFIPFVDDKTKQANPNLYEYSENEIQAYLEGVRQDKFLYVNSFISFFVAENKRIVALLTRPEFSTHFSTQENEAIHKLLPETHCFDETNRHKFDQYLHEFLTNRTNFVIKSSFNTRGSAVWLGKNCTDQVWKGLVYKLRDEPYIIQKFIPQVYTKVYDQSENPKLIKMSSTTSLYLVGGKASGIICRSSEDDVNNESRSGCVRPAFVLTTS